MFRVDALIGLLKAGLIRQMWESRRKVVGRDGFEPSTNWLKAILI